MSFNNLSSDLQIEKMKNEIKDEQFQRQVAGYSVFGLVTIFTYIMIAPELMVYIPPEAFWVIRIGGAVLSGVLLRSLAMPYLQADAIVIARRAFVFSDLEFLEKYSSKELIDYYLNKKFALESHKFPLISVCNFIYNKKLALCNVKEKFVTAINDKNDSVIKEAKDYIQRIDNMLCIVNVALDFLLNNEKFKEQVVMKSIIDNN